MAAACVPHATWLKRPGQHPALHVQQHIPAPPLHPFCGAWPTAEAHPRTLQAVPVVQVVENVHPLTFPFSNPPFVTTLFEHVGLHGIGVGDSV